MNARHCQILLACDAPCSITFERRLQRMLANAQLDKDVSVHGVGTRMWGVKAADVDDRPWIASFPVCPALNQYHIAHVGIMEAAAPYEIVRSKQTSTYFMACYGGCGRVLIDGCWRDCRAGMACLLPPHIHNAFSAVRGEKWQFCWVCYVQPPGQRPISDAASPVLARYDHVPLHSAILGLIHECRSAAAPALLQRWTELINEYVLRFARPANGDLRLRELWQRVTAQLGENWTLKRLASEAGYSIEHLRRLCHIEVGRSPMRQVIYLRMRRAADLLVSTNEKVEAIAKAVGYQDPFVFSRAFHKWVGWRPSDYRANRPDNGESAKPEQPAGKRRKRQYGVAVFAGLLSSVLTAFCAEDRSLPFGNPDVESPAAIRGTATRSRSDITSTPLSGEAAQKDRALREEQLRAARELFEAFPRDPDAVYVTGYVSHEQGDTASAIRYWEEMIKPEFGATRLYDRADALYNLGYTYLLREDYDKAISFLRESIRLNPRRQEAHYRLAHALFLKGTMEECVRVLDEAKIDAPLAHRLRGMANQQLGKLEDAKKDYESAVRLNPDLAEAYYGLAMVCARLGDRVKADECRKKFEALKSQDDAAGRQARTEFDPLAITRRSFARTHTEIGRVYLLRGQPRKAEELFLRAAEVDPDNTGCRFQLIMLLQQRQQNQEALRFAQEMVRAEPRNAFHYLAVGNLQARLRQRAEAESAFKKVIELAPGRPEGYFALAQLYLQGDIQLSEALRLARRAVELSPSPVNYYVLSQACARNGDLQGAVAAIEKACELDPGNQQLQGWRSRLQRQP